MEFRLSLDKRDKNAEDIDWNGKTNWFTKRIQSCICLLRSVLISIINIPKLFSQDKRLSWRETNWTAINNRGTTDARKQRRSVAKRLQLILLKAYSWNISNTENMHVISKLRAQTHLPISVVEKLIAWKYSTQA